jgi:general L-amino acid transport system permease protein
MVEKEKIPFWRDERLLRIALQAAIIGFLVIIIALLGSNLISNFQQLGLKFGLGFLDRTASFGIGDAAISYSPTDPYLRAILVGLLNSLRVMVIGIILATILGTAVGIGKLADNWLVRQIASIYVEILRNTPLLLQLFFWYFVVFLRLPKIDDPVVLPGPIFLTNKGINIPMPAGSISTWTTIGFLVFSVILAIVVRRRLIQAIEQRERWVGMLKSILTSIILATIVALVIGLDWRQPQLNKDANLIEGGLNLSPEYATLLICLIVYTAAFIAEVVRAGIQSVNKGQWEAAKALGFKPGLAMQLVIFPQALRVIIPPLTSEYLNLAKNSSLAIAIGYSDIYAVSSTISNQTGRAVEMLLIVMSIYLSINLIISWLMNRFNRQIQLKER